jgi:pyridoxal phosphate enzyme (YggS family)
MNLQDRYKRVLENIAASASRARRNVSDIKLLAVTKAATPEGIRTLIEAGQRDFAESRVQQLQQRAPQIEEWLARQQPRKDRGPLPAPGEIRWHMIGHLQRNKVRAVLPLSRIIHSVDSLRLAEEIQDEAQRFNSQSPPGAVAAAHAGSVPQAPQKGVEILLEVNVAEEGSKFGVAVGAAIHLAEQIDTMDDVQLVGLMCMAPFSSNPENARPVFVRLRELFDEIRFRKIGGEKFRHLSMGMSGDYQVAVEEGATLVRVGTAIFG